MSFLKHLPGDDLFREKDLENMEHLAQQTAVALASELQKHDTNGGVIIISRLEININHASGGGATINTYSKRAK